VFAFEQTISKLFGFQDFSVKPNLDASAKSFPIKRFQKSFIFSLTVSMLVFTVLLIATDSWKDYNDQQNIYISRFYQRIYWLQGDKD
jgi:hypothetical protein